MKKRKHFWVESGQTVCFNVSSKRKARYDFHNWLPTIKILADNIDNIDMFSIMRRDVDIPKDEVYMTVENIDFTTLPAEVVLELSGSDYLFKRSKDKSRRIKLSKLAKQRIKKMNRKENVVENPDHILIEICGMDMSDSFYRAKMLIDQLTENGYIKDDSKIKSITFKKIQGKTPKLRVLMSK